MQYVPMHARRADAPTAPIARALALVLLAACAGGDRALAPDAGAPVVPVVAESEFTRQLATGRTGTRPDLAAFVLANDSLTVGGTARPVLTGSLATDPAVRDYWYSTNTSVATVTQDGQVTALAEGDAVIVVVPQRAPYPTAFTAIKVRKNTANLEAPPSAVVPLVVRRFDGGSGAVTVSSAVPLAPGMLAVADAGTVRVRLVRTTGATEVPVYVRPLVETHRDGSVKAVLVQFGVSMAATDTLRAELTLGTARPAAMSVAQQLVAPGNLPAAAALPSDAAYLVASGIVGPTQTVAQTRLLGGAFARYDQDFATWADRHWASDSSQWSGTNYYDRALIYYAMWARTANPEYWRRAALQAVSYRRDYLEANNYGSSPHWAQLEGLEKHYLLTGDEASRTAVVKVGDALWGYVRGGQVAGWDQRINARALHGSLMAWQLQGTPEYFPTPWTARLDSMIVQVAAWQKPDGSYDTGDYWCHAQANFMVGLLNDALVKTYEAYRPDSQIVRTVRRSVDYLWGTQWVAAGGGFQYQNAVCAATGGTDVAADLNGLLVTPFAWLSRVTNDASYRAAGETVFAATVTNAYLVGQKQFNQTYSSSYRYLGYR